MRSTLFRSFTFAARALKASLSQKRQLISALAMHWLLKAALATLAAVGQLLQMCRLLSATLFLQALKAVQTPLDAIAQWQGRTLDVLKHRLQLKAALAPLAAVGQLLQMCRLLSATLFLRALKAVLTPLDAIAQWQGGTLDVLKHRLQLKAALAPLSAALLVVACAPKRVEVPETSGYAHYARYFDVLPEGEGVVTLSPYDGGTDTLWIREPLRRVVCMSTSHVAFLDALGADSVIVAVSGLPFVSSPRVRERIATGEVLEAGYDAAPALETIVSLRPDAVLTYSLGADSRFEERLREMGVRVFVLYEHLENHPLARSEYLRLFGALTGRRALADSLFAAISARYLALAVPEADAASAAAPAAQRRQRVLLNVPYAGQWFVPGADSYMSQLIRDAGGEVLGAVPGTTQSSVISIEKAYELACEADWWLNAGSVRSLAELRSLNAAFASFPVARAGRVYTNDRRSTPAGGNDFWESGVVRPDLILQDLRRIFAADPAADAAADPAADASPADPKVDASATGVSAVDVSAADAASHAVIADSLLYFFRPVR